MMKAREVKINMIASCRCARRLAMLSFLAFGFILAIIAGFFLLAYILGVDFSGVEASLHDVVHVLEVGSVNE